MVIALISVLVSSIALAGVAVSLLLQARQLRITQLQTARMAQLELIKMALDDPVMASGALGLQDPQKYVQEVFLNWQLKYLEMSYEIGAITKTSVQRNAAGLFDAQMPLEWWSWSRADYEAEAASRSARAFFTIVDAEYEKATRLPNSPSKPDSSEQGVD